MSNLPLCLWCVYCFCRKCKINSKCASKIWKQWQQNKLQIWKMNTKSRIHQPTIKMFTTQRNGNDFRIGFIASVSWISIWNWVSVTVWRVFFCRRIDNFVSFICNQRNFLFLFFPIYHVLLHTQGQAMEVKLFLSTHSLFRFNSINKTEPTKCAFVYVGHLPATH